MDIRGKFLLLLMFLFSLSQLPSCNLDDILNGDPVDLKDSTVWNPVDTTWNPFGDKDSSNDDPWGDKDSSNYDPWSDKDTSDYAPWDDKDPWGDRDSIIIKDDDTIWLRGGGHRP